MISLYHNYAALSTASYKFGFENIVNSIFTPEKEGTWATYRNLLSMLIFIYLIKSY